MLIAVNYLSNALVLTSGFEKVDFELLQKYKFNEIFIIALAWPNPLFRGYNMFS